MTDDFYAYTLAYPENFSDEHLAGTVFYAGKGTGDRINAHEREARQGVQSRKCDIIRQIWQEGKQVLKKKEREHLSEDEAFRQEVRLIRFYGPANLANEDRGCWSFLPADERPLLRREMERYMLTGDSFKVEVRKHYFWVYREGFQKVQVFGIRDLIAMLGEANITPEQIQILLSMRADYQQVYGRKIEDGEAIII